MHTHLINLQLTNTGQYFSCLGLLELASRMGDATGHFDGDKFVLSCVPTLEELLRCVVGASLTPLSGETVKNKKGKESFKADTDTPLDLGAPFNLHLNWWRHKDAKSLKTWAGQIGVYSVARDTKKAIDKTGMGPDFLNVRMLFKTTTFNYDTDKAARCTAATMGFSPNQVKTKFTVSPATEFLCLVGLQRCQPRCVDKRTFLYRTFFRPARIQEARALVPGIMQVVNTGESYVFESLWLNPVDPKHKIVSQSVKQE
jgi:CRISPR-associated protein Csb3